MDKPFLWYDIMSRQKKPVMHKAAGKAVSVLFLFILCIDYVYMI